MKTENNETLKMISWILETGGSFGKFHYWDHSKNRPLDYPYFNTVLTLSPDKKYIRWNNYGGSSNKNTLEDLNWIITEIFNKTPEEFKNEYITSADYQKMKTAIQKNGIH